MTVLVVVVDVDADVDAGEEAMVVVVGESHSNPRMGTRQLYIIFVIVIFSQFYK